MACMKTKEAIVENMLPRYTGMPIEKFGKYILLVNFFPYVRMFSEHYNVPIYGHGQTDSESKPMQAATANDITIVNFGMGSPMAALIMEMLTAIPNEDKEKQGPSAVLFLGKCGGLKDTKMKVGDLLLPTAAIRGEGTSDDFYPPEVPALPAFALQKAVSTTIREYHRDYFTGTVYTTNRRLWEHDDQFKDKLRLYGASGIDMETATLFTVGYFNRIPTGALLLVSDQPMTPEGVKTSESDKKVSQEFVLTHLKIGMDSLKQIIHRGETVRHLKY